MVEAESLDDIVQSLQMVNVGWVNAMYPATMINYGFLSRNVSNPDKFRQIRDDRIVLKRNKDPKQLPYKIVLNG